MSEEIVLENDVYRRILEKVAEEQGLFNVKLEMSAGSSKGDNYLGLIYRVRARGSTPDGKNDLHLILKTSTPAISRETIPTEEVYKREIYVYNVVLRELRIIQDEGNVDQRYKFSFVNCYHASDAYLEEMLVLEDLKVDGFEMSDRFQSADYLHTALVMSTLGKLHALSYVMKKTKANLFADIAGRCPDILCHGPFGKSLEAIFRSAAEMSISVIKDLEVKAKLEVFNKDIVERMQAATKPGRFAVLGHGDCWINNILFKYKNGVPVDIRLLDFQLLRYGSPVLDMLYFIFCCTDQAFRANHYSSMLDLYHDSLAATLKAHSLDIDTIFPKEAFRLEIERFADFGLGMAVVALRSFACDPEDATDFESTKDKSGNATIKLPTGEGYQRYVERINGVARDYVEYGYLK